MPCELQCNVLKRCLKTQWRKSNGKQWIKQCEKQRSNEKTRTRYLSAVVAATRWIHAISNPSFRDLANEKLARPDAATRFRACPATSRPNQTPRQRRASPAVPRRHATKNPGRRGAGRDSPCLISPIKPIAASIQERSITFGMKNVLCACSPRSSGLHQHPGYSKKRNARRPIGSPGVCLSRPAAAGAAHRPASSGVMRRTVTRRLRRSGPCVGTRRNWLP